ncbi:MAG: hypothetical protein OXI81_08475 [Paracoccaceae bacterium]|nr:hypothetical protein [Paracoccaceae bacterium]
MALLPAPVQAQTPQVIGPGGCVPAGVGVGESFRLLFKTNRATDLSRKSIGHYNRHAQKRAGNLSCLRHFNREFRAVVSTSSVDARDNTATTYTNANKGVPIYWLRGEKVADDYADFYDGSWNSVAAKDEHGGSPGFADERGGGVVFAATGSNADGTKHATAYAGASSVRWGGVTSPLSQTDRPNGRGAIYALSPVLTVVAKPEKPTGLTAVPGNQQVTLSWNNPDDPNIYQYRFAYRQTPSDGGSYVITFVVFRFELARIS